MLSQKVIQFLHQMAQSYIQVLIPLPQTTNLIMKKDQKFDRIDTKLIKQAEKLNKKQNLANIKRQYRDRQRVGAITYRSYTIQFKKQLITSIRQQIQTSSESLSKIIRNRAKQTGIHPKNITRWYHTKQLKKKQGGRRALYPEMEIRLANFIINNPKMKRKHILRQAKQIMEDLNIPGREQFNFSKGWYERFRERLSKKKVAKGARPQDLAKIQAKQEDSVKQQYGFVKKQQHFFNEKEDLQMFEDLDSEQNIKFQNYSQSGEQDDCFNVRLSDVSEEDLQETQQEIKKEQLYFDTDQEEEMRKEVNDSTERLIEQEKSKFLLSNSNRKRVK